MTTAKANGLALERAVLRIPLSGAWTADILTDTDDTAKLAGPVTVEFDDGRTLTGFAQRAGIFTGRASARLVGGAGGLGKILEGKHYRNVSARIPAGDIASDAGEALDAASDLAAELPHWTRLRGGAGVHLTVLGDELDIPWRVTLAGKILFAHPKWTDSALLEADVLDRKPSAGTLELVKLVDVGTTVLGARVTRVEARLERETFRTTVWVDDVRDG